MRTHEPFRSRAFLHVAVIALMAAGVAGCSSDTSRFNEPFSNPFASRSAPSQETTGSIRPAAAAPAARVESQPLPQTSYVPPPPPPTRQGSQADVTGSINAPRPAATMPGQVRAAPGARTQAAANGGVHIVAPGETVYALARRYRVSPASIFRANKLAADYKLRIGDRVTIPGVAVAGAPKTQPARSFAAPKPVAAAAPKVPTAPVETKPAPQLAAVPAQATARVAAPAAEPTIEAASGATSNDTTGAAPSFRWPVRGRIITGFGPKGNGQQNDGINLAVPEGTSVKAAEDGVVAYAGNELKGYGNLVLVRHSNGFVTAYAHASEVNVKRGDQVKRGQIIAKAGQTGNVTSPQLHFEIRKGATPVDPTQYLGGS
jgi:murein DD-endopeptidase MepM/ murein hydrolase activator NlpD